MLAEAIALHRQGRLAEAIMAFDRILALQPGLFEAHFHRGLVLKDLGRAHEALAGFERAAALRPADAVVRNLRALMLGELDRHEEALAVLRPALDADPRNPLAQSNYGHVLVRLQRHAEALPHFERAVSLAPDMAALHYNLGEPLGVLRRLDEALAAYDRAIALAPGMAEAHTNRGLVLTHLGRVDEALAAFDAAIALAPESVDARMGRSGALEAGGRVDEALAYHRELARNPLFQAEADFRSAFLHLARGEWELGWKFYEARRAMQRYLKGRMFPTYRQPEWRGEGSLAGRTLFVYGEQGLGDQIQFARYLKLARGAGAKVIFAPRESLVRLFAGSDLADAIQPRQMPPAQFDLHMPLASMPMAFGTRPGTIPADIPYLKAEPALVEKWRARLGAEGLRIGICWAGSPDIYQGLDRSFPLRALAPLAALPGVRLISLQKQSGLAELNGLPEGMAVESLGVDFDSGPDALTDTAAVMASLDLVISCDTSVAHLAGALGRPVWTALKRHPDWRWMLQDDASPWYATMTLFRQAQVGEWEPVFAAMGARLAAMLEKT